MTSPSSLAINIALQANDRCMVTVDDKNFDLKDEAALAAALKPYQNSKPQIHVVGGMETPYRCIGGLIYTLQRRGYKKIGFVAETPEGDGAKQR